MTTPPPEQSTLIERLEQMKRSRVERGDDHIVTELLERATYLHAMEEEGLSTIERQSMATMYRAADLLERLYQRQCDEQRARDLEEEDRMDCYQYGRKP